MAILTNARNAVAPGLSYFIFSPSAPVGLLLAAQHFEAELRERGQKCFGHPPEG
jgi:hypothetical protein